MSRSAVLAIAIALATSTAHAAPTTPEAIVREIYQRLVAANMTGEGYEPSDAILSPRLQALEAAARRRAGEDVPCGLDFSIWFDGQEYDLKRADVTAAPGGSADEQEIIARFDSLRAPHELHFTFRRIDGRWRLDEAESVVGTKWVFSKLLRCES